MGEREQTGDAETFAALFGGARPESEAEEKSEREQKEPEQEKGPELTEWRAEAARRYHLPTDAASRLKGETWAEVEADAKKLAELFQPDREQLPTSGLEQAQRELKEAEESKDQPNAAERIGLARNRLRQAELAESLGLARR